MSKTFAAIWAYLKIRKRFWLLPIILFIALLIIALIVFRTSKADMIYPLM